MMTFMIRCYSSMNNQTNGPSKLEWLLTLGQKDFLGKNTLAYHGHLKVIKNIKSCEKPTSQHFIFFVSYKWAQYILDCYITPNWEGLPGTNTLA
jgi:hypothetical protein